MTNQIHPNDHIFNNILNNLGGDRSLAIQNYMDGGRQTAQWLYGLATNYLKRKPRSLLDFASGYGRVTRHLQLGDLDVTASDIHAEAIDFLKENGLSAIKSTTNPDEFDKTLNGRTFDVVCVISFFTHMPRETWTRWLLALRSAIELDGILIFTTHGQHATRQMGVTEIEDDGFFYGRSSEQIDLSLDDYGSTVTTESFVRRRIQECGLRVVFYQEAGAGYQDLWIAAR